MRGLSGGGQCSILISWLMIQGGDFSCAVCEGRNRVSKLFFRVCNTMLFRIALGLILTILLGNSMCVGNDIDLLRKVCIELKHSKDQQVSSRAKQCLELLTIRVWGKSEKKILAKYISHNTESLELKEMDGTFIDLPLSQLSDADISIVKKIDELKPQVLKDGGELTDKIRAEINNTKLGSPETNKEGDNLSTKLQAKELYDFIKNSKSNKYLGLANLWRTAIEVKTWDDATGNYSVRASYVEHDQNSVILEKKVGIRVVVPIEKLGEKEKKRINSITLLKPKIINAIEEIELAAKQKRKAEEAARKAMRDKLAGKIIKMEDDRATQYNEEVKAEIARRILNSTILERMKFQNGLLGILNLQAAMDSDDPQEKEYYLNEVRKTARQVELIMRFSHAGILLMKIDEGEYITLENFWASNVNDVLISGN